jgi:hypothetical protein
VLHRQPGLQPALPLLRAYEPGVQVEDNKGTHPFGGWDIRRWGRRSANASHCA